MNLRHLAAPALLVAFTSVFGTLVACGSSDTTSEPPHSDTQDGAVTTNDGATSDDAANGDAGDDTRFAAGTYGGNGVRVTVAADGSATFEFSCASGATTGPIVVTETGSTGPVFQIAGTVNFGGPVEEIDGSPASKTHQVLFVGHKFGNEIAFSYTITDEDGGDGDGTATEYSATLGTAPTNLVQCA